MEKDDIITLYLAYSDTASGKIRPVLILDINEKNIIVFKITTKYKNKSNSIKKNYYKIIDWKESGLDRQSYIDTNQTATVAKNVLLHAKKIGNLSAKDIFELSLFLKK